MTMNWLWQNFEQLQMKTGFIWHNPVFIWSCSKFCMFKKSNRSPIRHILWPKQFWCFISIDLSLFKNIHSYKVWNALLTYLAIFSSLQHEICWFVIPGADPIFQQDNASCHTARNIKTSKHNLVPLISRFPIKHL